jgi:hypothetical protein
MTARSGWAKPVIPRNPSCEELVSREVKAGQMRPSTALTFSRSPEKCRPMADERPDLNSYKTFSRVDAWSPAFSLILQRDFVF